MVRRKVLNYLRPETHASERFADAIIAAYHRGYRAEMSQTALLAGLVLGEIDSRLPSMLAALQAENTRQETLNIQSTENAPVAIHSRVPGQVKEHGPESAGISAKNLADSLPE